MDAEQRPPAGYSSKYAYLSTLYFIAVGVLYLWGYWPTFELNILEYAGLTDIIKTAAYPITSFFVFFALGVLVGEFLSPADALPPGGGVNTPTGQLLRKAAPYLVVVYFAATLLLFFFGPTEKWRVLPVLAALPLYFAARRHHVLADVVAHDKLRSTLIFLLAALPFFAFGHGKLKALAIISGEEYTVTKTAIPGLSVGTEAIELRPRYLGVAGGHAFFYVPERRSTAVVAMGEVKVLELAREKTHVQSTNAAPPSKNSSEPQGGEGSIKPAAAASR